MVVVGAGATGWVDVRVARWWWSSSPRWTSSARWAFAKSHRFRALVGEKVQSPARAGSRRIGPARPERSASGTTAARPADCLGLDRCSRRNRSALRWGPLEVRSPSRAPILAVGSLQAAAGLGGLVSEAVRQRNHGVRQRDCRRDVRQMVMVMRRLSRRGGVGRRHLFGCLLGRFRRRRLGGRRRGGRRGRRRGGGRPGVRRGRRGGGRDFRPRHRATARRGRR